jgi:hypothetical protein
VALAGQTGGAIRVVLDLFFRNLPFRLPILHQGKKVKKEKRKEHFFKWQ